MKRTFKLTSKYECKEEVVINKLNSIIDSILKDIDYDSWDSFIKNAEKDAQKSIVEQIEYDLRGIIKQTYKNIPNIVDCLGDDLFIGYDEMRCRLKIINPQPSTTSKANGLFIYFTTYEFVLYEKIGSKVVFRDHINRTHGKTVMLDFDKNPVQFCAYEIS